MGSACIERVMGFARNADAPGVLPFPHDPYYTDDELDALLLEARRRWDGADEQVCLADEGMTIVLDEESVQLPP